MADTTAEIEALSLATMRAWVAGDPKAMKKLIARDFMMMVGTSPPQLLDRPSFLAAIERGFACTRFAFREVFVRQHGKAAWMVAGAELELRLGLKTWTGRFLVTDLWQKGAIGGWKLAERSLAKLEDEATGGDRLAESVRALQLWT
jgi:ketosteroid isomerase-like protein